MLFNSLAFIVFFPVTVFLFFVLPRNFRWVVLLLGSIVFYLYSGSWQWICLIFSIVVSYLFGFLIGFARESFYRKMFLFIGLFLNLGMLVSFKYFDIGVAMPLGLSFFVLQTVSYDIDVYRGVVKPEINFGIYALFSSFFPQVLSGPISRAGVLIPQLKDPKKFDLAGVSFGLQLMLFGFFKKLVIADRIAPMVSYVYDNPVGHGGFESIFATVLFAFQIYCDFSAYSDIAIGAAKVMGFDLPKNFSRPYFSASVSEFWRRWHISLSSWLRDYVYISLGGGRVSRFRKFLNVMATFIVSGIWHGSTLNFIIWGALNGILVSFGEFSKWLFSPLRVFLTFLSICFTWIFFRASNLGDAFYIISHLFDFSSGFSSYLGQSKMFFVVTILLIIFMEITEYLREKRLSYFGYIYSFGILFLIALFSYHETFKFIYLQF